MVLAASGRETRGQGTARATVTGTLVERDGATAVAVRTDLTVTGRPAQFGRGVLAEVGDRLVGQFADCLSQRLAGPAPQAAAQRPAGPATAGVRERREEPVAGSKGPAGPAGGGEAEPLDLLRAAGVPVAKRAGAAAGVVLAVALLVAAVRRLRRG
jgi:hypothetical protein